MACKTGHSSSSANVTSGRVSTPRHNSDKASPTPRKSASSSPRSGSPTISTRPIRNKRTFMACTECRRRQVKCNPSPTPSLPCDRCAKRGIKCEYLTRQEQQMQSTNDSEQLDLDSSSVVLHFPEYGPPAPQQHDSVSSDQNLPISTIQVDPASLIPCGSWNAHPLPDPSQQRQRILENYFLPSMEPHGHIIDDQLNIAPSAEWQYSQSQSQQQYDMQNSANTDGVFYIPQNYLSPTSSDWQWYRQ